MQRNPWVLWVTTAAIALAGGANAGEWSPPGPPGPTMHSLEEIYQKLETVLQLAAETRQQVADLEARLNADGRFVTSGGMALIPAGEFVMGDTFSEGDADELPLHTVNISAFFMDRTLITKAHWDEVASWAAGNGYTFHNDGRGKDTNHPVHSVNWHDCLAWANARSQYDGFTPCYTNANGTVYTNSASVFDGDCDWSADGYRLPTEAEWEKAARGGVPGRRFPWPDGNTIRHARANYRADPSNFVYDVNEDDGYHPGFHEGSTPFTSPVGSFAPNGHGLFDMAGNLAEWCWDWYSSGYYGSSPGTDPRGPPGVHSMRVIRGGCYWSLASNCRVARRDRIPPGQESGHRGFRLVRRAP